jgi:uncharacterized protein involved in exopolysaccharide biosynthesis
MVIQERAEQNVEYSGDDAIDLRELFAALASSRWSIFACVACCTAVATAYVLVATPVYRSTTVVAPAAHQDSVNIGSALGQLGGIAALAGIGGGYGVETEEALAVLRSREFTERFLREESVLPALYPESWDVGRGRWRVPRGEEPSFARAYQRFHLTIRDVTQDKKTGLIAVSIDWKDREKSADWANKLVARVNEEMRRRAVEKADRSLGFLERELQTTSTVETRAAISHLIESEVRQRMLANVTDEFAFRVVDRALPADVADPVRPRKLALIAIGAVVGSVLGVMFALWRAWRRSTAAS